VSWGNAVSKSTKTYSISELSREFKVTPRALRFYEDKGLLAPRREGLSRIYSARERGRLQIILRGKRLGFPLSDIKEIIDLYDLNDGERTQMTVALKKFRQRLTDLKAQKEDIDFALSETERGIEWLKERLPEAVFNAA
jgi:DNA-binding transcriptional MerR regulator